jgi:hypothetical protein
MIQRLTGMIAVLSMARSSSMTIENNDMALKNKNAVD